MFSMFKFMTGVKGSVGFDAVLVDECATAA